MTTEPNSDATVTCVQTHTPPMDFAQCETHDTTFPLGQRCKFYGRELWEVYAEEADQQRQRAVRLELEVERLATNYEDIAERWNHAPDAHTRQIARRLRSLLLRLPLVTAPAPITGYAVGGQINPSGDPS